MSLSGSNTGALRPYTARQMMESALRRAGVPSNKFSAEITEIALDEFNTMMDEMLNLGIQLWGRDRIILPLYQNENQVPCPLGTSVVISLNQRSMSRQTVINPFTDQGGDASFAFDDDFDTSTVQTLTDGSIGGFFSTPTTITTVGILFTVEGEFDVFYEFTTDGSTWFSADSAHLVTTTASGTVTEVPQEWKWVDIEGLPPVMGARIRNVGTTPLSVGELYFGNSPTEIPMGSWNLDDWVSMPVKNTLGAPFNWYQQRDLDAPVLYVWPMPNDQVKYYQLIAWRRRYLDQVTAFTQTLDVSRRWLEAMTASLARRLCRSVTQADMSRYGMLSKEESDAMMLATGEERDPAPMRYSPGLDVYQRNG